MSDAPRLDGAVAHDPSAAAKRTDVATSPQVAFRLHQQLTSSGIPRIVRIAHGTSIRLPRMNLRNGSAAVGCTSDNGTIHSIGATATVSKSSRFRILAMNDTRQGLVPFTQ